MVSDETREEDERLREELQRIDLAKLKKVIKPLLRSSPVQKKATKAKHKAD